MYVIPLMEATYVVYVEWIIVRDNISIIILRIIHQVVRCCWWAALCDDITTTATTTRPDFTDKH